MLPDATESVCLQVTDKSQVLKVSKIELKVWPLYLPNDLGQIHWGFFPPFNLHLIKFNHYLLIEHQGMFLYNINYTVLDQCNIFFKHHLYF